MESSHVAPVKNEESIDQAETVSREEKERDDGVSVLTDAQEKALVRRIDLNLMPLMLVSYMLQFFDKTTLGYTAILGLQADTGLTGTDYSWVTSIFYFGYLFASYPASLAFVKLPLGKFLAICILVWAIVLGCHGTAQNFSDLMALRFFLGVFESTISPGFSLVTSLWYKPSEHASRHGFWFAGNTIASIFGGLLAYAISHIHSSIAAWRWLYIIFGIVTFFWGVVLFVFLPDSPLNARFLQPDRRTYAYYRPQQHTHSPKTKEWKKAQFVEALLDPKTWFIFVFTFCSSMPNGGYTSFSGIIVEGFGFDAFTTLLLLMPGSAFGLFYVVSSTSLAHRVKYSRCILMAILQFIALIGCAMVYALSANNKWTRLGGMWLFQAYAAALPLSFAIVASNVAGYTKKTTVLAILFIAYCTANIAGPQLFKANEAPTYGSAFKGLLVCIALAIVSILMLRQYMVWENKRRDRDQGVFIDPEAKEKANAEEHLVQTDLDETDWVNKKFRYYL